MGNEKRPSLYLGVVAIEKGPFGSPSTKVANFISLFTHIKKILIKTLVDIKWAH